MFCYRDMTFCSFDDCKHWGRQEEDPDNCFRSLTDKVRKNAEKWMKNPPICEYANKPECFEEKNGKTTKAT